MLTQQARMPQLGRHIHTSPGAKTSAHPATPQTLHGSQRLYSLKPASHHRSPRNQDLTSPLSLSVLVPAPRCNARLVPHAVLDKIHGDASSNPSTTRSESSVPCAGATATPRPPQDRPTKLRALVFGSGLAGLATARVLSDHFDEVFLLERDGPLYDSNASSSSPALPDLQDIRARRKGVPQFQQPHVLLKRGLDEMEKLLPGVQQTLLDSGAHLFYAPRDIYVYDTRYGKLGLKGASMPVRWDAS
eukprot:jgi/Chrzof1/5712/Cz16g12210.t1